MDTEDMIMKEHEHNMRKCIAIANIARKRGDSPVGSIIVLNGKIVGEGTEGGKTRKDITYHAEIEAIRHATALLNTQDLTGCTMYTTHEPCIMCSYAIRHTRISTIVMGIYTGAIGGYSSRYPLLTDTSITKWGAPPVLVAGVLEQDCMNLLP